MKLFNFALIPRFPKSILMKIKVLSALLVLTIATAHAQYYYKDLLANQQAIAQWKAYKLQKVGAVNINSFESDNRPTPGFECQLTINRKDNSSVTATKSDAGEQSELLSYYNEKGQLIRTVDTSDEYKSVTEYAYDDSNRMISVSNTSITPRIPPSTEVHLWSYTSDGQPGKMLKIVNDKDTTFVTFVIDDKGHVSEEKRVHKGLSEPTVYYYYNEAGLLTDIVRYNVKAQRMLPDYMFGYDAAGRMTDMLVVLSGSTDYQKWYYRYNDQGLKTQETCFDKHKALLGKIDYNYTFN